jgi:protein SCO1/2
MRMIMAIFLVFVIGAGAIYRVTDGLRVVTSEQARRLSIAEHPRKIPDTAIQFERGSIVSLSHALDSDGRVTIVNFIYTRCNAICSVMSTQFQQLQDAICANGLSNSVRLLSISFDPEDAPEQLAAYAMRMHAQPDLWRFTSVPDATQRAALLNAFGITVILAPLGAFEHNAAFHIVTRDGRLSHVVDYDSPDTVMALAAIAARKATKQRE